MTESQQKLFKENMGLVGYCYRTIASGTLAPHKEDIMQEGYIGLTQAAIRWDEAQGTTFATYACSLIRGKMLTYKYKMIGNKHGINYGRSVQLVIFKYNRLRQEGYTAEQIKEELKIDDEMAYTCESHYLTGMSLNQEFSSPDTNGDEVQDRFFADPTDIERDYIDKEYKQRVRALLDSYCNRSTKGKKARNIFKTYAYSQIDERDLNQEEIAHIHCITQSMVSRSIRTCKKEFKLLLQREGLYEENVQTPR